MPDVASVLIEAAIAVASRSRCCRERSCHGVPVWRGLAAIWFKKVRKRRPAPSEPQPGPAASAMTSMRRVIDRTPPAGPVSLGNPPAGRSALDQQRARA